MTDYRISEEELFDLIKDTTVPDEKIEALIKSKTPIEPLNRDNVYNIINENQLGKFDWDTTIDKICKLSPQPEPSKDNIDIIVGELKEYEISIREDGVSVELTDKDIEILIAYPLLSKLNIEYATLEKPIPFIGGRLPNVKLSDIPVEISSVEKFATPEKIRELIDKFMADINYRSYSDVVDELSQLSKPEINCYSKTGEIISEPEGEVIAEGELNYVNKGYTILCLGFTNRYKIFNTEFDEYIGTKVEVRIHKCKESK